MKKLLILIVNLAAVASPQITWKKVWPPVNDGTHNPPNGYEDIAWDSSSNKVWIYSTNGTNSGSQIYSIRLHYFDPIALTDTNIGDNGQTSTAGCFVSSATWPSTHHAVGQFWVDQIRQRVYTVEGVGCTERSLEEWLFPIGSPISGNAWTEVFSPGLATDHPGEKGAYYKVGTTTLSAPMASSDTSMSLTTPGYGVQNEFYLIDSEIVRVTSNGNPYMMGPSPTGTGSNPFGIARAQYGTASQSHAAGAAVYRLNGQFDNGKVVHDTYHDAFFWLASNTSGWGSLYVKCDSSGTGTLSALQQAAGCSRPDDWVDITSKSICTDSVACAATQESGTNGSGSGRLPHGWYYPSMDFDPTSHTIIFFAGGIYQQQFQYSFVYNPETFTWTRLNTTCSGLQCTGLLSLRVTAGGSGYTTAPAVTINGCNGAGATANLSNGAVASLTITSLGTACSAPTVAFSGGGGSGAAATATANTLNAPPVYSSNSENTRIAHAVFQGKMYYHLSQHGSSAGTPYGYTGAVQDWVLDPVAQTWTELQTGVGPTYTEAMTVDPATGNLYAWVTPTAGSDAEIWQGQIGGASVTSGGSPPAITSGSPLPQATQGSSYSFSFAATGTSPVTWSAAGLPSGLSMSSAGVLSGTPAAQGGPFTIAVTATNSAGVAASNFLLTVASAQISSTQGFGYSTYNCVDVDGDGYGVGSGCLGPDADDTDATVHSASDVLAKWGTLAAFWAHLGWTPNNVLFVDGGTGSCTRVASPFVYSAATACATIDAAVSAMSPGDAVVVRGGVYSRTAQITLKAGTLSGSTCTVFSYYLSYPGELPDFEYNSDIHGMGFGSGTQSCAVIDGFKLHQSCLEGGTCSTGGYGIRNSGTIYGFTVSHNDVSGFTDNLFPQFNQIGTKILHNYLHEALAGGDFGHNIYLGSDCPGGLGVPGQAGSISCPPGVQSTGTIIQGNIIANGINTCIHANGPMQNILVDSNLIYGCNSPMLFQSGVNHSTIQNNVVHTSGVKVFDLNDYAYAYSSNTWQCHDQNYNVIRNNTFFMDGQSWSPSYPGQSVSIDAGWPAIEVADDGTCQAQAGYTPDMGHNTYANNILVHNCGTLCAGYKGPVIRYAGAQAAAYLQSDTYVNNLIHNFDTSTSIIDPLGVNSPKPCSWFTNPANVPLASGNICGSDPLFIAANPQWNTAPANWNLAVQPTSPAVGAALASNAPAYDILGRVRGATSTIGAYEANPGSGAPASACDLSRDGVVNAVDVQIAINQALGVVACTNADLNGDQSCNVVDIQRIINASNGDTCKIGP